jgi:cold shock CspA family protein
MAKVMLFIDGTWLYANSAKLAELFGKSDFHIDYSKLPRVVGEEVGRQLRSTQVDVVRTHLFGSYPANYDLRDDEVVQRRLDFFNMLREEYHYEVETFPINFRGRRVRRADRDPDDPFEAREKCVDISLATAMLYYAAIPWAYDIAVAVVGDRDFIPVLQHVRRLGKRVAIASIRGSCAQEVADLRDEARVRDFDVIWLDGLLPELELKYEPHQLACESPTHRGDRPVWTTFHPRKGQKFYCDTCRAEFSRQVQDVQHRFVNAEGHDLEIEPAEPGRRLTGTISRIIADRRYGFIRATDGSDYFFHLTDLDALEFDQLEEGLALQFEIKKEPGQGKAGAARNVRRRNAGPDVQKPAGAATM